MIAIYGLFLRGENCVYVGQSAIPVTRALAHRALLRVKRLKMVIFKWVRRSEAAKWETRMIQEYKSKGQARINRMTTGRLGKDSGGGYYRMVASRFSEVTVVSLNPKRCKITVK